MLFLNSLTTNICPFTAPVVVTWCFWNILRHYTKYELARRFEAIKGIHVM